MPFEGDERAVTVVIGAVLMFGILVTSLAMYQVNVVPDQNQGTEWDHHQEVTGDLLDLRNAVVNAGYENSTRETSVSLGTQYESRTFSINPPDPQGTIRTNSTGNPQVVVNTTSSGNHSFDTSYIEYEPGYNEYDAPTTVIEHGLIYDEHGDVNVTRDAGGVISDERVIVPLIEGDLSQSSRSSASITVETVDVYHVSSDVSEIRLPTNAFEAWNESYDVSQSGEYALINPDSGQDVYIAQIAVGDDRSGNTDTSSKLDSFGDPVTNRGGTSESNEFGLEWAENSVSGSPGETVTLTARIDDDVENARADFSLRDSNDSVDSYDPSDPVAFQNGDASFDVTLADDATDGDRVGVYVSSGGTTKEATLTVTDGSDNGLDVRFDNFDAPESGTEGEEIQPNATVTNVGNESGTATVEYVFDGSVVDSKTLNLDPGQQTIVSFNHDLPGAGTYGQYAQSDFDTSNSVDIDVDPSGGIEYVSDSATTADGSQSGTASIVELEVENTATNDVTITAVSVEANGRVDVIRSDDIGFFTSEVYVASTESGYAWQYGNGGYDLGTQIALNPTATVASGTSGTVSFREFQQERGQSYTPRDIGGRTITVTIEYNYASGDSGVTTREITLPTN